MPLVHGEWPKEPPARWFMDWQVAQALANEWAAHYGIRYKVIVWPGVERWPTQYRVAPWGRE